MGSHQSAAGSSSGLLPEGYEGVFYRLLGWDVLRGKDGTLERWHAGNYSTVHLATLPVSWLALYFDNGSRNPDDYERADLHDDALANFLKKAANYDSREAWERTQPLVALPINGVCAFSNEIAVLQYATQGSGNDRYVATCKAKVIRSLGAETDGYLVTVTEKLSIDLIQDFVVKFKLSMSSKPKVASPPKSDQ
jgi:hypothetical protein